MGFCCCPGTLLNCPMGMTPTPLIITPKTVMGPTGFMANCLDCAPIVNITPFGTCNSLANPSTAAFTAAAFGVLTPGPCIPTPIGVWAPTKPNVICMTSPVLVDNSFLTCAFGGVIKINTSGQFTVMT